MVSPEREPFCFRSLTYSVRKKDGAAADPLISNATITNALHSLLLGL